VIGPQMATEKIDKAAAEVVETPVK
jgi:hypothetical protein